MLRTHVRSARRKRKEAPMALDLSALSRQVRAMSGSLATEVQEKQGRTSLALGRYLEESHAPELWAQAVELSRETAAASVRSERKSIGTSTQPPGRTAMTVRS